MPYTHLDPAPAPPEWKQELAERLATHRSRRPRRSLQNETLPLAFDSEAAAGSRAAISIAATVAARYAQAPSYQEIISSLERSATAADSADKQSSPHANDSATQIPLNARECEADNAPSCSDTVPIDLTVQDSANAVLYSSGVALQSILLEPAAGEPGAVADNRIQIPSFVPAPRILLADASASQVKPEPEPALEELLNASVVLPSIPLPANLIEFPRQLVAARKSRPRLAEGPLREDAGIAEGTLAPSQLRIFEVEPDAISRHPETVSETPAWSSIHLDADSDPRLESSAIRPEPARSASRDLLQPLQPASLEARAMALVVDLALVAAALLAFIAVFVASTAHPPTGKPAWIAIAITFAVLLVSYQVLFFALSEGTPGMRYARIALCTFEDDNPSRRAMRLRLAAWFLSAGSLGLGVAWAWFDVDRLAWHDRISRMYQRSY